VRTPASHVGSLADARALPAKTFVHKIVNVARRSVHIAWRIRIGVKMV
jgi:hypothetical protein